MRKNIFSQFIFINSLFLCLFMGCTDNSNSIGNSNNPPKIRSITANPSKVTTSQWTTLTCVATDLDSDSLTYIWTSAHGVFSNSIGSTVRWQAPDLPGIYSCKVLVSDKIDITKDSIIFDIKFPNRAPRQPYNPNPPDGATNISTSPTLTWECSDPDLDPITYDIYFGKTNHLQLVKINHTATSFKPGILETGESYMWKVNAKDDHGHEANNFREWTFKVGQ
jgi:hypothetical protein